MLNPQTGTTNYQISIRQRKVRRLAQSEGAPVGSHIAVVFVEAPRKPVMTVSIGYEIKELRVRGVHRRFQRTAPRIPDRTRRQAGISVSVLR